MTPWIYSRLTLAKEQAPTTAKRVTYPPAAPGQAQAVEEAAGGDEKKNYIDAVAALVPADVLAFHAFVVSLTTDSHKNKQGDPVTTITHPGWLKAMFIAGIVWAIAEYTIGHLHDTQRDWDPADFVRALIPGAAFVVWTALQKTTAFDAWFANVDDTGRWIVAGAIAVGLAALAKKLSDVARDAAPKPSPTPSAATGTPGVAAT